MDRVEELVTSLLSKTADLPDARLEELKNVFRKLGEYDISILEALQKLEYIYFHGVMEEPPPPPSLLIYNTVMETPAPVSVVEEVVPAQPLRDSEEDVSSYGNVPAKKAVRLMSDGNIVVPDLPHHGNRLEEWWLAVARLVANTPRVEELQKKNLIRAALEAVEKTAKYDEVTVNVSMSVDPKEAAEAATKAALIELGRIREAYTSKIEWARKAEQARMAGVVSGVLKMASKHKMVWVEEDGEEFIRVELGKTVFPRRFYKEGWDTPRVLDPDNLPEVLRNLVAINHFYISPPGNGRVEVFIPENKRHPHASPEASSLCTGTVDTTIDEGIIDRIVSEALESVNMNSLYDSPIAVELLEYAKRQSPGESEVWDA